jgi:hypothetical protein
VTSKGIAHLSRICMLLMALVLSACSSQIPTTDAPGFSAPTARPSSQDSSSSDTSTAPTDHDWGDSVTWEASDPHADTGIRMDAGGDVDTEAESWGEPQEQVQRTGNGVAVPSDDGNDTEDYYLQFDIDDAFMYDGSPTSHVLIEVEYLDLGMDMFSIHYDASGEGGPFGDGTFTDTGLIIKTDSGEFKTAVFQLRDARFANRDNDADFRIADSGDGPEFIRRVTVTLTIPSSDPSAPLFIDFYDDGNYLDPGQCTTLHWIVQNASEVALDSSQVDPEGYRYVCPESTTTYVLQAQNDIGDEQRSITIVVAASPSSPGSTVYDFRAFCDRYVDLSPMFLIYFEGQPGELSGPITYQLWSGVDLGSLVLRVEDSASLILSGHYYGITYPSSDTCCQTVLINSGDTNLANDTYTACW